MSAQKVLCRLSVPFWGTQAPNARCGEIQGSELGTEGVEGQETLPTTERPLATLSQGPNASAPGRGPKSATAM